MAVICVLTMIALTATMALMTVIYIMTSIPMSYTILHISVINAVMDMVIMASISITALMATLANMDIKV